MSSDRSTTPERDLGAAPLAELVERLRAAESPEKASGPCEEVIRRFEPLLRKTWHRRNPPAEYADFAQEVFVRLFHALPQLRDPAAFPGFFRTIMLSVLMDTWRKSVPEESLPEEMAECIADIDRSTSSELVVRSYAQMLKQPFRSIVELEILEGLSSAEIAKRLGMTAGGVRSLKSRAMRQLRDVLLTETEKLEKKRGL
jgi:RNA polymerase sigma-70 factor, ECF subfamily